ncbi:MAG: hypothetical protein KDH86_18515, partial [Anaerolineae bacterium]|nr:hypothetical protein [Anaerolineae bacterium]
LGISWDNDLLDPANSSPVTCYVDDQQTGAIFLDGGALVGPLPATTTGPASAHLQHGIELLGNEVESNDRQLQVSLEWVATEPIPGDYTVFVHLFDAAGNKIAQGDGPPRDGYWPTSHWRPGEPVSSTHTLLLPPDLPAGQYTLGAGMYDPVTGQRLFAYDAAGNELRDWMIILQSAISF